MEYFKTPHLYHSPDILRDLKIKRRGKLLFLLPLFPRGFTSYSPSSQEVLLLTPPLPKRGQGGVSH